MDPKAMAKSKRSHTKHNQPKKPHHHHHNNPKATSSSTDPNKQTKDKKPAVVAPQKPSLPSNWDRYEPHEDEGGEGQEIPIDSKKKGVLEGVVRKSKGADFGELIAHAKESQHTYPPPSFHDGLPPDFHQGLVPMLAVKSESITSLEGADDFLLEGEATTSRETPSLTLDLKALAEDLAKVDLAKRLFLEPDLLPLELRGGDATEAHNELPRQNRENRKNRVETFADLYSVYLEDERLAGAECDADKERIISSSDVGSGYPDPTSAAEVANKNPVDIEFIDVTARPQLCHPNEQNTESESVKLGYRDSHATGQAAKTQSNNLGFLDGGKVSQVGHISGQDRRPSSRFAADAAEAELDTLLDSFGETKLSDSGNTRPPLATSVDQNTSSVRHLKEGSVADGASVVHSHGSSRLSYPLTSCLNDDLDDLLEETSKPSNQHVQSYTGIPADVTVRTPSKLSFGPSRQTFPLTSNLDDELDNLLDETSKPTNKGSLHQSAQAEVAYSDIPSSSPSCSSGLIPKSEVLDDFDSWLDTIS